FNFLDQTLNDQYQAEQNSSKVFTVFAGLAIIIACVGLFGLSAYTAGLRTKEIGVRKVMGASVFGVVLMLSKDFTKLILIAFLLAIPVAYYGMDQWLQGFSFRINLVSHLWAFAAAGFLALFIALLTVSYQAIRASLANPVEALRYE
ncbi:ABC transporter permease, partial [candidate division KSB1 bacterium]|nr:ABC transporter permease [candidate division KSB1 bacterium]